MSPGYKASTPGALVGHLATCPCASLPHAARHQPQNEMGHRLQRMAAHPEKYGLAFDTGANHAISSRAPPSEMLMDVHLELIQPPLPLIQLFVSVRRARSTASLSCTSFSFSSCACKSGSSSSRATARELAGRGGCSSEARSEQDDCGTSMRSSREAMYSVNAVSLRCPAKPPCADALFSGHISDRQGRVPTALGEAHGSDGQGGAG